MASKPSSRIVSIELRQRSNPLATAGKMSAATVFGQVIVGPPGSGKTTYCKTLLELLKTIKRKAIVINLDPANDVLPYECAINISTLITLEDVMKEMRMGPNGGLVYCMEYLEANLEWLTRELAKFPGHYVIFDFPGQVELYTHHHSVRNILQRLGKEQYKVCTVHLVDSYYCTDPAKFISVLITALSTMMLIELPHVNVLSKMDLIEKYGKLDFNLDYYTEVLELSHMVDILSDDPVFKKYKKLTKALAEVVQDYSLVSFYPLNIQDNKSRLDVLKAADRANGYVYDEVDKNQDLDFQ